MTKKGLRAWGLEGVRTVRWEITENSMHFSWQTPLSSGCTEKRPIPRQMRNSGWSVVRKIVWLFWWIWTVINPEPHILHNCTSQDLQPITISRQNHQCFGKIAHVLKNDILWDIFTIYRKKWQGCLERIADYTTNIAEDVIYMIDGTIVRHNPEIYE